MNNSSIFQRINKLSNFNLELHELETDSTQDTYHSKLYGFARIAMLSLLVFITLSFGAVHYQTYYFYSLCVSGLCCWLLLLKNENPFYINLKNNKLFAVNFTCLAVLLIYSVFQSGSYSLIPLSKDAIHPISHSSIYSLVAGLDPLTSIATFFNFLCIFCISSFAITNIKDLNKTVKSIGVIGIAISLIALGHWLTDNGKLFGVFSPNSMFISERARWPFVNPNHLATFLILCAFIITAHLLRNLSKIDFLLYKTDHKKISDKIIALNRSRSILINALVESLGLVAVVIAILATQSKGGLLALALGSILFFLSHRISKNQISRNQGLSGGKVLKYTKHKKVKNSTSPSLFASIRFSSFVKYSITIVIVVNLVIFISGTSSQLLTNRIVQSAEKSVENVRLDLLKSTWSHFQNYWLFGSGLSSWKEIIPHYYTEQLVDINPVYLHNDPFQLMFEIGIIGFLPIVVAFIFTSRIFFKRLREFQYIPYTTIALYSGLVSVLIHSLFDFSLRIPAVTFLFGLAYGLLTKNLNMNSKVNCHG